MNLELLFSKAEQRRKQPAASRPDQWEGPFPLSVEARELMVSSSKLWPLAAGPIIHGGSSLPVLPSDWMSLTGREDVGVESLAYTGK